MLLLLVAGRDDFRSDLVGLLLHDLLLRSRLLLVKCLVELYRRNFGILHALGQLGVFLFLCLALGGIDL